MMQPPPVACVLGEPIAHSLSPVLHGYWLQTLGITGYYVPIALPAQALPAFVQNWRQTHNMVGGNITVPHKKVIMPLLDECTPLAQRCGAVNTVIRCADGRLQGHNTDGTGLVADLHAQGIALQNKKVMVLGAGGAAAGIIPALCDAGAQVWLYNRTAETAQQLIAHAASYGDVVYAVDAAALPQVDIVINTMTQSEAAVAFLSALPLEGGVVYDINYKRHTPTVVKSALSMHTQCDLTVENTPPPNGGTPLEEGNLTVLLQHAAAAEHYTRDGLGMLIHQAVEGFAAWFGQRPVVGHAEDALLRGCL